MAITISCEHAYELLIDMYVCYFTCINTLKMDADFEEEAYVPGKKRKHMSKFKRAIKKKKPRYDPG